MVCLFQTDNFKDGRTRHLKYDHDTKQYSAINGLKILPDRNVHCKNGIIHRLDGPAIYIYPQKNGCTHHWYINGIYLGDGEEYRQWLSNSGIDIKCITIDDEFLISRWLYEKYHQHFSGL